MICKIEDAKGVCLFKNLWFFTLGSFHFKKCWFLRYGAGDGSIWELRALFSGSFLFFGEVFVFLEYRQ